MAFLSHWLRQGLIFLFVLTVAGQVPLEGIKRDACDLTLCNQTEGALLVVLGYGKELRKTCSEEVVELLECEDTAGIVATKKGENQGADGDDHDCLIQLQCIEFFFFPSPKTCAWFPVQACAIPFQGKRDWSISFENEQLVLRERTSAPVALQPFESFNLVLGRIRALLIESSSRFKRWVAPAWLQDAAQV